MFIGKANEELEARNVLFVREHGSVYILKLSRLKSIEEAEELQGADIYVCKEALLEKEEGEYFYFELMGLEVYLDTGHYLGVLKRIFETGSNDVYVVQGQEKEYLIPAIYQVVKEVNLPEKRMVISPMKDLLDLK